MSIEKKLIPAKHWSKQHAFPSQGAVNTLIINRHKNGLCSHIVRINNRLYIIEDEFLDWILRQRESSVHIDKNAKGERDE